MFVVLCILYLGFSYAFLVNLLFMTKSGVVAMFNKSDKGQLVSSFIVNTVVGVIYKGSPQCSHPSPAC